MDFTKITSRRFTVGISLVFVFILFFTLRLNTPMHSDDFSMALRGWSIKTFLEYFFGWGGAVIPYWLQVVLIRIENTVILAAIISLIITFFLFLIVLFCSEVLKSKFSVASFLIISSLYLCFNPNLGQTTFWLVGFAGYLAPLALAITFIYLANKCKDSNSLWQKSVVCFLAFLSCICVAPLSAGLCFYFLCLVLYWQYYGVPFNKSYVFMIFLFLCLGTCLTVCAPGNYVRMAHPIFADWGNLSIIGKIKLNIYRIKDVFSALKYPLFFYFFLLFLLRKREKKIIIYSLLFFLTFCATHCAMVFAPHMPLRVLNLYYFFLLIAISLLLQKAYSSIFNRFYKYSFIVIFLFIFVIKWLVTLNAYHITMTQDLIRNEIITDDRKKNGQSATPIIPIYYFVNLFSPRDEFDTFFSGSSMKKYYGVKHISEVSVDFDYSIIYEKNKYLKNNRYITSSVVDIKKLLMRSEPIYSKKTTFIISITDFNNKVLDDLYVEYKLNNKDRIYRDKLTGPFLYKEECYLGTTIRKGTYDYIKIRTYD